MTATATKPKERPILFTGQMVREILAGRKTQTRRIVKLRKGQEIDNGAVFSAKDPFKMTWPHGQPGDRLWVRETWSEIEWTTVVGQPGPPRKEVVYRAGPHPFSKDVPHGWIQGKNKWRPSIHMPRSACRIELEVTGVRIDPLLMMSEHDAISEGFGGHADPVKAFAELWDQINGSGSWESCPDVWVIEFRRIIPE